MARYPDSFVNRVQQATDIVEVVGQYVALKKSGREFAGLCLFHDDHHPSMRVSPAKQIFKCFACGAGGDVFGFLVQLQRVSFREAVSQLAQRAGISVPEVEPDEPADRSISAETLVKVTTFAARHFRDRLNGPDGSGALAYARRRGLTDESIRRFGVGYATDTWEGLRQAGIGTGFSDRQLSAAGLVAQREDGTCYDRFRDRLMFPILDAAGRVIAFGGRAMSEDQPAKYLNSPETVLFDKSANLYAINWARDGISRSGRAVVVEGYLDALLPLQAGVDNVVATMGTSLTDRHVRLLGRYAREVVLVFDADAAGQAAAERAIEIFLSQRLHVRVATVPSAGPGGEAVKDPCDYVLAAGAEAMRGLMEQAPDALEFAWSRRQEAYLRAGTLPEKLTVLEEFLRLVASSAAYGAIDALRQGLLAGRVAELVGLSPAEVSGQLRRLARRASRPAGTAPSPGEDADKVAAETEARAGQWLLGALLNEPGLFESVRDRLRPEMFTDPATRSVAESVWHLAGQDRLELTALLRQDDSPQWGRLVTDLHLGAEARGNHQRTVTDAAEVLLARWRRRELTEMRSRTDADPAGVLRKAAERAATDRRRLPRVT